ncbi:MAG: hypothetical protein NZ889_00870 [Candidatus Pacearchaeota archaeon]|nr:hypothetical protein [Candidatus Pacearchaeota archaeon]
MKITIEKKEYKPLVERTEILAKAEKEITPTKEEIREQLSSLLEKPKELIVVKHIYQQFGKQESKIIAYVYDSQESLKKFEKNKKEKQKNA